MLVLDGFLMRNSCTESTVSARAGVRACVWASVPVLPGLPRDVYILWLDCQPGALEMLRPSLVGVWELTMAFTEAPRSAPAAVCREGTLLHCCTCVSGAAKKGEKPIFPIWVTLHVALWHAWPASRVPALLPPRQTAEVVCFMKPCPVVLWLGGSHDRCLSSDNQNWRFVSICACTAVYILTSDLAKLLKRWCVH